LEAEVSNFSVSCGNGKLKVREQVSSFKEEICAIEINVNEEGSKWE